jgi:endonuclease III-like uncharacterized protein
MEASHFAKKNEVLTAAKIFLSWHSVFVAHPKKFHKFSEFCETCIIQSNARFTA